MKDNPLVSIIIPSFNQGKYLEETISSVLNQDYNNFELIVIDGGSNDNSVDIIKRHADRIKYWISEKDEGQTDAIIKGLNKSDGEYFMWLCSDDVMEPSMLSVSVYFHKKYPDAGLTYGDRIRIDAKGNIYSMQRFPDYKKWFIKWGFSIPQETTLIKKSVYDKTEGLDKSLHMGMDFDLWCKLNRVSNIYHIPAYLGRFRNHGSNKSAIFSKEYSENGYNGVYTKEYYNLYLKYFGKKPAEYKIFFRNTYEHFAGFIERRTVKYKKETELITKIRLDENTSSA
ncbi:MAG: glycosyltransferase family 2 protein [Ignavibacteria bacterium]|nr:glycosyltransferase family 2 protein [Ignavibacteria bacterium]